MCGNTLMYVLMYTCLSNQSSYVLIQDNDKRMYITYIVHCNQTVVLEHCAANDSYFLMEFTKFLGW